MRLLSLFVGFAVVVQMTMVAQNVHSVSFAPAPIRVDGHLDEWSLPYRITHRSIVPYINLVQCGIYWDWENLYLAFDVQDNLLCLNEPKDNSARLYLNDAVEIYIDSKYDSKNKMDLNDYQIIISLTGQKTIFKGDKLQILAGNLVPKDNEGTNIVVHAKSKIQGTINKNDDQDTGFQIEASVSWSAIGIEPKDGLQFKMDLCNDDVDTIADMRSWPERFQPLCMNYANLKGMADFGFPEQWAVFELIGGPGAKYALLLWLQATNMYIKIMLGVLLVILLLLVWYQNSRLKFYRNFPQKWNIPKKIAPTHVSQLYQKPALSPDILSLKNYITSHIEEDLPIDLVASQINVSVRQLQRLIKAELEMTPKQYITILKLEYAEKLLQEDQWSIAEVAFRCGFAEPSYFSAVFRKYFGKSPQEYKKAWSNASLN